MTGEVTVEYLGSGLPPMALGSVGAPGAGQPILIPGPPGPTSLALTSIVMSVDGGTAPIAPGVKGDLPVPFDGEIVGWTLLADQPGDVTVDVWADSFGNFPPTDADSITAAAPMTLAGSDKAEGSADTWIKALSQGATLRYVVEASSNVRRLSISLHIKRD